MPVNPWIFFSFSILSFVLLVPFPSTTFAVNQQGETLLSWKRSFNGLPEVLSDWEASDETPCRWFGITCNFNNQVLALELRYVDLFGNVPSNFTSLFSLKKLILSGTNLTGPIPKEIGALSQLTSLDLSDNALTGEIPSELCNLLELEELYLNSNKLEGSIPIEIGNLTSLKWLILYDNQLSGGLSYLSLIHI